MRVFTVKLFGRSFIIRQDKDGKFILPDKLKQWRSRGTALKPAWENITVAMKPLDGTFAANAEKHGVAGLWIDGGRISAKQGEYDIRHYTNEDCFQNLKPKKSKFQVKPQPSGRWPANLILDEEAGKMLDEQSGVSKSKSFTGPMADITGGNYKTYKGPTDKQTTRGHDDSGGASRFFFCAKASKRERGENNNHPTVKPLALIEYLCKLTKTPDGGIVLDPFGGSGTTALACIKTDRKYILIEKEEEYCNIARARIQRLLSISSYT